MLLCVARRSLLKVRTPARHFDKDGDVIEPFVAPHLFQVCPFLSFSISLRFLTLSLWVVWSLPLSAGLCKVIIFLAVRWCGPTISFWRGVVSLLLSLLFLLFLILDGAVQKLFQIPFLRESRSFSDFVPGAVWPFLWCLWPGATR